jgi:hypothetical protein
LEPSSDIDKIWYKDLPNAVLPEVAIITLDNPNFWTFSSSVYDFPLLSIGIDIWIDLG